MANDEELQFDHRAISPSALDLSGMLLTVYERWLDTCHGTWAPTWTAFALEDLPARIIPWCVAVNVHRDPPDFTYRFWGTERARLQGQELTGRPIGEFAPASMAAVIRRECEHVVETRSPLLTRKTHTPLSGVPVGFESLRVPLSDGADAVAVILSVARAESLTPENYRYFGTEPPLSLTDRGT